MRSESTRRLTQPRTVLTWWSRPRLRHRGRDAGYPAPPAQIRAGALTHTAPAFGPTTGVLSTRCAGSHAVVVGAPPVSRFPGAASGTCFGSSTSRWPRPFPPPTPPGSHSPLFAGLHRYNMTESDFSGPYICGYGFLLPAAALIVRADQRSPRSRQKAFMRAWGLGHRGARRPLTIARPPVLPSADLKASALQNTVVSMLISLPT